VVQYLPILILGVLALGFTIFSLVSSAILAPRKKPSSAKLAPYECGIVPDVEPPQRFPVRFYLVSMIFIIFDIEIVFLYPWAVGLPPDRDIRAHRGDRLRGGGLRVVPLSHLQRGPDLGAVEGPAVRPAESDVGVDHHPDQCVQEPQARRPDRWVSRTSSTIS